MQPPLLTRISNERCVSLIGMAGAGKSTLASLLAGRLGWASLDTDRLIEATCGEKLPDILAHVLEDAKCIVLDIFENVPPGQSDLLKERIRSALRRFFRKILERDPVVVPLVITL